MRSESVLLGADQAKQDLDDLSRRVIGKLRSITHHYGLLMKMEAQSRARNLFDVSTYDNTITMRTTGKDTSPRATVSTSAPEAHRLEYGFVGVDALGRHVEQPPRPHFRPAFTKYAARYRQAIEELLG